jgi:hypothetical protein
MQNSNTSSQTIPNTNNNGYAPSIPISLYREVTAELQGTKAQLESVQAHNQQLTQQNQNLRQEINKLIRAAMQLQQTASSAQAASLVTVPQMPSIQPKTQPQWEPPAYVPTPPSPVATAPDSYPEAVRTSPSLPTTEPEAPPTDFPEHLFTELPDESRGQLSTESRQAPDIGGVWLMVAIFLIVVAFFGAGYWVVRPLLQQQQR